ncbi:hypothetical protein EDB92DRAFT_1812864 [Lactarius akahatsu]|uniref:Uncharacterized protein n=1 Tax=Lactarius akahatsu TaxID=416441 RepID=A0AAD4LRJ1_9AGAM|nr:hypothetical protein EDB92DRAFT_1812864 [Lactarius akahatsu]
MATTTITQDNLATEEAQRITKEAEAYLCPINPTTGHCMTADDATIFRAVGPNIPDPHWEQEDRRNPEGWVEASAKDLQEMEDHRTEKDNPNEEEEVEEIPLEEDHHHCHCHLDCLLEEIATGNAQGVGSIPGLHGRDLVADVRLLAHDWAQENGTSGFRGKLQRTRLERGDTGYPTGSFILYNSLFFCIFYEFSKRCAVIAPSESHDPQAILTPSSGPLNNSGTYAPAILGPIVTDGYGQPCRREDGQAYWDDTKSIVEIPSSSTPPAARQSPLDSTMNSPESEEPTIPTSLPYVVLDSTLAAIDHAIKNAEMEEDHEDDTQTLWNSVPSLPTVLPPQLEEIDVKADLTPTLSPQPGAKHR